MSTSTIFLLRHSIPGLQLQLTSWLYSFHTVSQPKNLPMSSTSVVNMWLVDSYPAVFIWLGFFKIKPVLLDAPYIWAVLLSRHLVKVLVGAKLLKFLILNHWGLNWSWQFLAENSANKLIYIIHINAQIFLYIYLLQVSFYSITSFFSFVLCLDGSLNIRC